MYFVSAQTGYAIIFLFGLAMIILTYLASRSERWRTSEAFLLARRDVPWFLGAPSIAASWIWAPALFVSIQKSYELGLAGIFWFTAPNILALVVFAILAPRIRRIFPNGYTLPQWIRRRFDNRPLQRVYMLPYVWYQLMAVCVQLYVGGLMLNYLTGIPLAMVMILLLLICLCYSLISGLRASIVTDFIQVIFIISGAIIIPIWVLRRVGLEGVRGGLTGIESIGSIWDLRVAFSFGIVTSIGLIAGAISDQQYWQRAFAIKRTHLVPAYVVAGILFGFVPILLSILGFVAANPAMQVPAVSGSALPMVGIEVVIKFLPAWAVIAFVIMLLSGLMSTLDSAMCAASSLWATDFTHLNEADRELRQRAQSGAALSAIERERLQKMDTFLLKRSRLGMYLISVLGLLLAWVAQYVFALDRLWWIFNGVAACFVVPTVLSLYSSRLSSRGILWSLGGASLGMLLFVYGNWVQDEKIPVYSMLFIVVFSLVCCLGLRKSRSSVSPMWSP